MCQPDAEPADFEITYKSGSIRSSISQRLQSLISTLSHRLIWKNDHVDFSPRNTNFSSYNSRMSVDMTS